MVMGLEVIVEVRATFEGTRYRLVLVLRLGSELLIVTINGLGLRVFTLGVGFRVGVIRFLVRGWILVLGTPEQRARVQGLGLGFRVMVSRVIFCVVIRVRCLQLAVTV